MHVETLLEELEKPEGIEVEQFTRDHLVLLKNAIERFQKEQPERLKEGVKKSSSGSGKSETTNHKVRLDEFLKSVMTQIGALDSSQRPADVS